MTCDHCARSIESAVLELPGVAEARVDYPSGRGTVQGASLDVDGILAKIRGLGYQAEIAEDATASLDTEKPHIAIIGTGSAAFAAAIEATGRGARVTLVERAPVIGGTCVNIGCVPSKILIRAAHIAHLQSQHPFRGLPRCRGNIDRPALLAQQQARVEELRHAKYESILEQHPEIALLRGEARFLDAHRLEITGEGGHSQVLEPDRILIATGARPALPEIPGLADTPWWSSTEALATESAPEHLVVLGGSVVALELAQAFLRLGSRVTLLARSTLLSREDPEIGALLAELLEEEGMALHLHTVPESVAHDGRNFHVHLPDGEHIECDRLLVATGRRANTDRLGLEKAGVETDPAGRIRVDERLCTSQPHIYAAGDCTTLPQYVYVAAAAGTRAAINMTGGDARLDLSAMPAVVFTEPAVATVGMDTRMAAKAGLKVETRRLDLDSVPRALANFDTRGFIKLVAEAGSGRLLGCQVVAAEG
ncbi:MAG: mercury(II) reductase, partial [Gammaproteobacteria bacterium]